jgi:hypothetical protein
MGVMKKKPGANFTATQGVAGAKSVPGHNGFRAMF